MFTSPDICKLSKNLMTVVKDNRIYHTSTSANANGNFLVASGLTFPLVRAETIEDSEARYLKRNEGELDKFRQEQLSQIENIKLQEIKINLEKKEDLMFFFNEVCPLYSLVDITVEIPRTFIERKLESRKEAKKVEEQDPEKFGYLLSNIITRDCLITNRRVYPLSRDSGSSLRVNFNGEEFGILGSPMKQEDIERAFLGRLEERLKRQALVEFKKSSKNAEKIKEIEEEIRSIEVIAGVKKYTHSYEFGNIGYDFSSGLIFWMLQPHYNETSGKNYGEGESAVTQQLKKGVLDNTVRFADRPNRTSPFSVHSGSNCYGGALSMPAFDDSNKNSLEDKIFCLSTCARMINDEHKFYQAPQNDSS